MKKNFQLFSLFMIALLLAACSSESPAGVSEEYSWWDSGLPLIGIIAVALFFFIKHLGPKILGKK